MCVPFEASFSEIHLFLVSGQMNSLTEPQPSDFQAAFGSMSLDDPNVLAGLSTDGTPFFSGTMLGGQHFPDTDGTPMPMKLGSDQPHSVSQHQLGRSSGAVPTPSRESDTRELREFWKAYMRTPLTGPGLDVANTEGGGGGSSVPAHTPISYRRPRVASLPNNKTPVVEKDRFHGHQHHSQHPPQQGQNTSNQSSLRTTLRQQGLVQPPTHAAVAEDLRSYEAAVMALKTPMTLNLQPRCLNRRVAEGGSAGSSPVAGWGRFSNAGHLAGGDGAGQSNLQGGDDRLAGAFGRHQHQSLSVYDASSNSASPASHRSPSADVESGSDVDTSQGGPGVRPSFKRVASHTLEPDTAKVQRMYSGGGGVPEEGHGETKFNPNTSSSSTRVWLEPGSSSPTKTSSWREPSPNWRDHAPIPSSSSSKNVSMDRTTMSIMNVKPPPNINLLMTSHPDRVVAASLADRRRMRRMSAPVPRGFAADGVGGGDGGY
jgi:hypothetical protein